MSPRMAAEERKEQVLHEAIPVFARYGFEGVTTAVATGAAVPLVASATVWALPRRAAASAG